MTLVLEPADASTSASGGDGELVVDEVVVDEHTAPGPVPRRQNRKPTSVTSMIVLWTLVLVACLWLVLYLLEPLFQQRQQHLLLVQYQASVTRATFEAEGPDGVVVPTKAPSSGSPVGVVEIPGLRVQQAVVEGVSPSQTQIGPGHVPGTAGLGQPGNSALLARHATFGAPFRALEQINKGDDIVVTTTQGRSLYKVDSVGQKKVVGVPDPGSSDAASTTAEPAADGTDAPPADDVVTVDALYGKTKDDQLTIVTSASYAPWNGSQATVVVAKLQGQPFAPTPQGGRTDEQTGLTGDPAAWAPLLVALSLATLTVAGAVWFVRRFSRPVAYLIVVVPLIGCFIVFAETVSRMLPAWW